jgi:monovalent cation:H+ antiporter-2, CPA2 family
LSDTHLLFELILLLALTAAGLALFERMRLPAIAGFLVVGAIAGPGGLGLVPDPDRVRLLAEIGVIFLLFEIGLELPLSRLRDLGRMGLIAGGTQVVLTVGIVALGAGAMGLPPATALILGGLISMSSTALVIRLLSDEAQIDAPHGRLAVSVLVFQDLAIVPFLLAIPFLADGGESSATGLIVSVLRMGAALALVIFIVRIGVPRVLNAVAKARSPDLFSLLALLIVLGSAFLAEELGLTLAVGAFLAGVAAASSPYAQQLFSEVVPLRGVVLGIFFTAIGMLFEPQSLMNHAPLVILYLTVTLLLKTCIVAAAGHLLLGYSIRAALLAGLALSQTGEFTFVLAEAAAQAGLLGEPYYQVVLSGSILSLLASPFVMRAAPRIADVVASWSDRSESRQESVPAVDEELRRTRVVIIGYGPAGQTLTRLLRSVDIPYVIIDNNPRAVERAQAHEPHIHFGDATRPFLLNWLGVEQARLVVVAISDALATRRIVTRIRLSAPDTPVLARTRYVLEVDPLENAGATSVVAEEFEASIELVARTLELFEIAPGPISRFTQALRDEGYGAIRGSVRLPLDPWLMELLEESDTDWIDCPDDFVGERSLQDLDVRARTGCTVLAVERDGQVNTNPSPSDPLHRGDRLLVLGEGESLAELKTLLGTRPAAP